MVAMPVGMQAAMVVAMVVAMVAVTVVATVVAMVAVRVDPMQETSIAIFFPARTVHKNICIAEVTDCAKDQETN